MKMLAIAWNILAFYLGAEIFERAGIFGGVFAFLVTALVGTIMCSVIEEYLGLLFARVYRERSGSRSGRSSATATMP